MVLKVSLGVTFVFHKVISNSNHLVESVELVLLLYKCLGNNVFLVQCVFVFGEQLQCLVVFCEGLFELSFLVKFVSVVDEGEELFLFLVILANHL